MLGLWKKVYNLSLAVAVMLLHEKAIREKMIIFGRQMVAEDNIEKN